MRKSKIFIACAAFLAPLVLSSTALSGPDPPMSTDGFGRFSNHSATASLIVIDQARDGMLAYSLLNTPSSAVGDTIVFGDWNGDGAMDPGAVRDNGSNLLWILSTPGGLVFRLFGKAGDKPVPGNWDPSNASWELGVTRSNNAAMLWETEDGMGVRTLTLFGDSTDDPVPGNWDNSAGTDMGVTRVNGPNKRWITQGSGGITNTLFGAAADTAYPGDFTGDGNTNFGVRLSGSNVFRLSNGMGGFEYKQFAAPTSKLANPGS